MRRMRRDAEASLDTRGGGALTDLHVANFLASVRGEETPTAPIRIGRKSQLLCHLGNIAQATGEVLHVRDGHLVDPPAGARELWGREYQPGWEPVV